MKTFYVTFGLGSVLRHNYLIVYAPTELDARQALNESKLPWAGIYSGIADILVTNTQYYELASAMEVLSGYGLHYGPCAVGKYAEPADAN